MKNKSSYHRSKNTFHFKTFHEHVAAINITAVHKLAKLGAAPDAADTFFGEALDKWKDLNCTSHFVEFCKKVDSKVKSLTLLVHHQQDVVRLLQAYLKTGDALSLAPLLALVVQLARDLQIDFYPYFRDFFVIIVNLLHTFHHEVNTLEQVFTSLSYLFKFLWRPMLKDINQIFTIYSSLLGSGFPDYINSFAAESFSFLLRKLKCHKDIINLMFDALDGKEELCSGIGHLFFELVKGVQKQFHSKTPTILPTILLQLGNNDEAYGNVEKAILVMVDLMLKYTSIEHADPLWTTILDYTNQAHQNFVASEPSVDKQSNILTSALRFLHHYIQHKEGKLVLHVGQLIETCSKILKCNSLANNVAVELLLVISTLLLSEQVHLQAEQRPKLLQAVLKSQSDDGVKRDFCRRMFALSLVEKDLLPMMLQYSQQCYEQNDTLATEEQVLCLITQFLLHRNPPIVGSLDPATSESRAYIDVARYTTSSDYKKFSFPWLVNKIITGDYSVHMTWAALFCFSQLKPVKGENLSSNIINIIQRLKNGLHSNENAKNLILCTINEAANALNSLEGAKLLELVSLDTVMELVRTYPMNAHVLKTAALYFTCAKHHNVTECCSLENFTEVLQCIQGNLSSAFSQIRLLSLSILNQFALPMPTMEEGLNIQQTGVFEICLEVEQSSLTVVTYRNRLLHLRKLDFSLVKSQIPSVELCDVIPLRYLIGNLYVNFSLLWKPVRELIKSHAKGLPRKVFWEIYGPQLDLAASNIESIITSSPSDEIMLKEETEIEMVLSDFMNSSIKCDDKPDHVNFRNQIWTAMQEFPEMCEPYSKVLSPLVFRLLENEYFRSDVNSSKFQNLQSVHANFDDTLDDTIGEDKADVPIKDDKKEIGKQTLNATKSLISHLELFALFRNPKALHMEPKLYNLYFEFLQHRNLALMKVAFSCLMTYKLKYLTPYQENFERLLDDKTFKNEIVLFSIDEEQSVVNKEHRKDVLPVLMRILNGKMQTKTGKDSSGRSNSQYRKDVVIRFLAGTSTEEIGVFMDLILDPVQKYGNADNLELKVQEILTGLDLSKVIPLRKQKGVLNSLDILVKRLGHLTVSYQPKIYRILVCLAAVYSHILDHKQNISPGIVNATKSLRQIILGRLTQFFSSFHSYSLSLNEINSLFSAVVWPQIEKLPNEGIYSPTPLLKLLGEWAQIPRFFGLLAKHHESSSDLSSLPFVFQLLRGKDASNSVTSFIMDMVENLLREDSDDDEDAEKILPLDVGLTVCKRSSDLPYGVALLMPHSTVILEHIRDRLSKVGGAAKKVSVPKRELGILSILSKHAVLSDLCTEVVQILLPLLAKNLILNEGAEADMLLSLKHMVQKCSDSEKFLPELAALFSVLSSRSARSKVCDVVEVIAEACPQYSRTSDIVKKLNSWDRRRVEEPDYLLRLEGFEEAGQIIESELDSYLILVLIHNCCYFLTSVNDMSLRDASTRCITDIIKQISKLDQDGKLYKLAICQNLLPLIKKGIREKEEGPRHEFIQILSCLVHTFHESKEFSDFHQLTDEDVEVDFFKNLTHIQLHRRARALRRVGRHFATGKLSVSTLYDYILPLSTVFIQDPGYSKYSDLVDAAVSTIGVVAKHLPWERYLLVLRHYLRKLTKNLEQQKLMVRIIIAILDAFHFDLKNSHHGTVAKPQLPGMKQKTNTHEDHVQKVETNQKSDDEQDDINEVEDTASVVDIVEEPDDKTGHSTGPVICPPGLATRIEKVITQIILPQLFKCLAQKTKSDDEHKKAQAAKYAEDDEILRVPIALAMVKLLQSLPGKSLEHNLPGVLLKVCHFLRSRSKDIRITARDTLTKIIQSLGPNYFMYVLRELRTTLNRGYQRHVLGFTVWALLKSITPTIKSGDLDNCVHTIVEICNEEIFGEVAEEKDVEGIVAKLFEAKTTKSYFVYGTVASLISTSQLSKLVIPLKEILDGTHSLKKARKAAEVLKHVCQGLVNNANLELNSLLIFVYGFTTEALPFLKPPPVAKKADPEKAHLVRRSTYILAEDIKRGGKNASTKISTNMYVLVEFGLEMLFHLLKRSKLVPSETAHLQMADPFVDTLVSCLSSKHVRVVSAALRCVSRIMKFPLPSLKKNIKTITSQLFVLLKNYASSGAAKGDNFELVVACFKTVTVLVREVQYHIINEEQLHVLLNFCEMDASDSSRQGTAFSLLKAILSRKLVSPVLADLIKRLEKLSITSEASNVRLHCRQVAVQYMLDYPLGGDLKSHLEFYVTQLSYDHEAGRESALEMMASMFGAFPTSLLGKHAGLFFVPLASRLINEESATCRHLSALALKSLLTKLASKERDQLFNVCSQWLQSDKAGPKKLAVMAIGLFVEVETMSFETRLPSVLQMIAEEIDPSHFDGKLITEGEERQQDHFLFSLLNLLLKIFRECAVLSKPNHQKIMNQMWQSVEHHITHPHMWVQLVSAQLYGLLFASLPVDLLVKTLTSPKFSPVEEKYMFMDLQFTLHSLCGKFCKQISSPEITNDVADQVVKNLVFLAKLLKHLPKPQIPVNKEENTKQTSFLWLLRRLCKVARTETAATPKIHIRRKAVMKWFAAVSVDLGKKTLPEYLPQILQPVVREYTDQSDNADADLKQLCQDVLDLIKEIAGLEAFSREYATVQKALSDKRDSRKRVRALDAVTNPEVHAKRTLKKNLAKKETKKRKLNEMRPSRKAKKPKY